MDDLSTILAASSKVIQATKHLECLSPFLLEGVLGYKHLNNIVRSTSIKVVYSQVSKFTVESLSVHRRAKGLDAVEESKGYQSCAVPPDIIHIIKGTNAAQLVHVPAQSR